MARKKKKSWREKLADSRDLPKVEKITAGKSQRWGTGTVVVPAPVEVDGLMRQVPKGKLTTINEIRAVLATRHGATICCPITADIFAWIAAHAADEAAAEGKKRITPYWRTLKLGDELNPKYPGGIENLTLRLQSEGHTIIRRGKRYLVENYEPALARLKP